ncbi:MAG: deoxyribose-phosphate aldolase [Bacteroidota bacterium]|nr:deoxyribose-phosphate aldolase [Bacteroidota bacterium]
MDTQQKSALIEQLLYDAPVNRPLIARILQNAQNQPVQPPKSRETLARLIDHTLLRSEATAQQVRAVCEEAREHGFAAVCIAPCYVEQAATWLKDAEVAVCTVVGFPTGANYPSLKALEAGLAVRDGATEIDMVINIGWLKSGRYRLVERDVRSVVDASDCLGGKNVKVKAILETALLTDEEIIIGSLISEYAGADYIKTSTGFAARGATPSDIALIRCTVEAETGIKASGGIKTFEQADILVRHGATRIGTSRSTTLIRA